MPQKNSAKFVCPSPKVSNFQKKKLSLGVRSPWGGQCQPRISKKKIGLQKGFDPLIKAVELLSEWRTASRAQVFWEYSSPYFMANYHLLGRKVENCLLGLFDDPDRPRSPDHGEKISKSCVIFITRNYLDILISIAPIQYTRLVIQFALQSCKNI